jgi:hypothetical protein
MAGKHDIEELVKEAKPLWKAFRARARRRNYERNIRDVFISISAAESALDIAGRSISRLWLDKMHKKEMNTIWTATDSGPDTMISRIMSMEAQLSSFREELSGVTNVLLKRPANRPKAKYVSEVLELMWFYEQRTEKRTLFPKGMDRVKEEAHQDSTEFIYQCLRRIEPDIKLKQAISAIRNAQMLDKQINALLQELRVK